MDNEDEIDRILAQVDVICESPELLGTVRPSTHDTTVGTEGMAPVEGGNGGVRMGGDSCHGSPPSCKIVQGGLEPFYLAIEGSL